MKKGKEWFIKELLGHEIGDYGNYYNSGYEDGLAYALKLAHQLDEPEKVVIPRFVATFIEDSRNKVGCIVTAIWEMYEYEYRRVYEWALEDGNDEVLMKAFANGYEVEKEKLYYIKFSENQYAQRFDGTKIDSMLINDKSIAGKFTKEEIEKMNSNFMALAVEVSE